MSCPDENVLLDFAENRLSGSALRSVKAHLETCGACSEVVTGDSLSTTTQLVIEGATPSNLSLSTDSLVGQQVGEYRVEELVGSGGMGLVYRGVHPLIGKTVAVKVLRPELAADPEQYRLMLREARAMTAIDSQRIVDIFAFGQLPDGRQYMVMEFLRGESLGSYLKRSGLLPVKHVLDLCLAIVDALEPAHRAGIIHRDLKPSNLFIVEQPGSAPLVKLLDFGLAKRSADQEVTSMLRGTPAYMSPEQATAQRVDQRADLYSLGVIMFELATGQRPFKAKSLLGYVKLHVGVKPVSPRSLRSDLPAELDALVLALLEKDPTSRPASCAEVRKRLQVSPRKSPTALLGLGAIAALGLAAVALWPRPVAVPEPPRPVPAPVVVTAVAPEPQPLPPEPAAPEPEPQPKVGKKKVVVVDQSARLLKRATQLKQQLIRGTAQGEEPDPVAVMLLDRALKDAADPASDLRSVENVLAEVERKYVRPR